MSQLRIADGLKLPIEAVTEKLAFLGRTGSGKTYGASKLAEEMDRVGAQFIVLDPVGKWWGLRLAADGKAPGISIPVFGGLHGDVPLEPTAGKLVADLIADRGISVVLDVSQFESDAAKARFASDFADRFFFRKKSLPSACHLFLEEAQEFVPQNPQRDEATMLHRFTRYVKLGRNFGLGCSLISQRPQEVNKKVLNQTELLFAFQMTGPQERKTVEGWIAEKGIDEDIAGELPKLKQGAPHVWSPAWLSVSKVVKILPKLTYDASSTPKVGARAVEEQPLAPVDLAWLQKEMAATVEKAKAEDPKLLRQEIARLKAEAAKRPTVAVGTAANAPEKVIERVELPVLTAAELHQLEEAASTVMDAQTAAREAVTTLAAQVASVSHLLDMARQIQARATLAVQPAPRRTEVSRPVPQTRPARERSAPAGADLPVGERTVLTAVAQYPDGIERSHISILAGYKRSTRDRYIQFLQQKAYVGVHSDRIVATPEGISALGDFEPLPSGQELQDYWRSKLPVGERAIFDVLVRAGGQVVPRDFIDEATGFKRSTRDRYLQFLQTRRLVVAERDGVRASEELFS